MKIEKGTLLNINHSRKGKFKGIATEDFDAETAEFYPIALALGQYVRGISTFMEWVEGEEIPCRASLCTIGRARV